MVVVAIAGGTGEVGRTFQDAIAKAGKHEAIILSRTTPPQSSTKNKFPVIPVDYTSIPSLTQTLQTHKVDLLISVLVLNTREASQSQLNLIRAASQSGTVTRFLPSEYYIDFNSPIPGAEDILATHQLASQAELALHPNLTSTLLRAGIFLDHLTMPYNSIPTHIGSYWVFVDLVHERCVFPAGKGKREESDYTLVLTHSTDVAAYVERLIGLPAEEWPKETVIRGNELRVGDLGGLVKRVTGKEFDTTYDSAEDIFANRVTPLPSNQPVLSDPSKGDFLRSVEQQIMLSMLSGAHVLPGKDLAEIFPDVQKTKIEDFFRAGWEMKQRMEKE